MENQEYMKALREQYEQYGDFAFLEGKIQAFIKANGYNVKADDVRKDLKKIVKWNELVNKISNIDDAQSYLRTLKLFYSEFGDDMLGLDMRNEFVSIFKLDSKFQIDSVALEYDILDIKNCIDNNTNSYHYPLSYNELLTQYYKRYGNEMFLTSRLEEFADDCANRKITIPAYGISQDLREIKKKVDGATPPKQKQNTTTPKQSTANKPKQTTVKNNYTPPKQTTEKNNYTPPKQTTEKNNYTPPKKTTTNTYYTPPKPQTTKTPQNYNKALGILEREASKSLGNILLSIANEVMKSL